MTWAWRILAVLLLAAAGAAEAGVVVSAGPQAVALTIYREGVASRGRAMDGADRGLAFVSETRVVDLPAGRSRVRFEGVADGLIPQSAAIDGLAGRLIERNFDYDLLSPGALIGRALGRQVSLVRTNPRTGRQTTARGILRSGPAGVVLDFGDHVEALRCDGAPERLVFDAVPPDLAIRPTLSAEVDVPRAGRQTLVLSYLAVRLSWAADYVARLSPDETRMDLEGWITLADAGDTAFSQARTGVVAGNLSRVLVRRPRPRPQPVLKACWPSGTTHGPWPTDEIVVTAARRKVFEALQVRAPPPPMPIPAPPPPPPPPVEARTVGDYHLYVLTNPTDVAARQSKQVRFLQARGVPVRRVDRVDVIFGSVDGPADARKMLLVDNARDTGVGQALPVGAVQLKTLDGEGRERWLGASAVADDTPAGQSFELDAGIDPNLIVRRSVRTEPPPGDRRGLWRQSADLTLTNAGEVARVVEVRCRRPSPIGFAVTRESAIHGLKSGDPLWRVEVPAHGVASLAYDVAFQTR